MQLVPTSIIGKHPKIVSYKKGRFMLFEKRKAKSDAFLKITRKKERNNWMEKKMDRRKTQT